MLAWSSSRRRCEDGRQTVRQINAQSSKATISERYYIIARSEYHTQLAKMSFDEIFDLTAGVYFHFL